MYLFKSRLTTALLTSLLVLGQCGSKGPKTIRLSDVERTPASLNTSSAHTDHTDTSASSNVRTRDHACLTEAIYFEAGGTGRDGMRAVAEVVLNRKDSPQFPNTVCGVVDHRYNGSCQFSYRCDGRAETYSNARKKALSEEVAHAILSHRGADITNGALFFHSASIPPGWFGTLSRRGQFGGNIFYK